MSRPINYVLLQKLQNSRKFNLKNNELIQMQIFEGFTGCTEESQLAGKRETLQIY